MRNYSTAICLFSLLLGVVLLQAPFDVFGDAPAETPPASDSADKAANPADKASDSADKAANPADKASEGELSQEEKDRRQIQEIDDESYALYQRLVDTIEQVEENYVRPISRKELIEAAIAGVVAKLDPYSNYIPEESVGEFRTDLENRFGGLGINVSLINKKLTLVTPLANSPAYQAGLKPNDIILEIDGKSTKDQPLEKSIEQMRGNVGSKIVLTISRKGLEAPFDVSLDRDIIHKETVCGCSRQADDSWNYWIDAQKKIAYVRISMFSPNTGAELKTAMKSLSDANLQGLILDLRFNPGGVLGVAIETCDLFVDQGVIVSTRGRNISEKSWSAHAPGTLSGFPMVVLINKYSASAAEIVSACLQDHNRAVVMGERSWGKGSVQNVIEMNGSALKLTTSGYYRPSGNNIHRMENMSESDTWGVSPNKGFEIKLTSVQYEQILWHQRTLDILNNSAAALPPKSAFRTDLANEEAKSADEASNSDDKSEEAGKTDKTDKTAKAGGANKTNKPNKAGKATNPAPAGNAQAVKKDRESPFIDNQIKKAIEYLTEKKK